MRVEELVHGKMYYTTFGKGTWQFPILWDAETRTFLDLTYGESLTLDEVKVIAKLPELEPLDCTPNVEESGEEMMDGE